MNEFPTTAPRGKVATHPERFVYLDRAQITAAYRGDPTWSPAVAQHLAENFGFRWVISDAHIDDLAHAGAMSRDSNILRTWDWPRSVYVLVGHGLHLWEHLRLLGHLLGDPLKRWYSPLVELEAVPELRDWLKLDSPSPETHDGYLPPMTDPFEVRALQKDLHCVGDFLARKAKHHAKRGQTAGIMNDFLIGKAPLATPIDRQAIICQVRAEFDALRTDPNTPRAVREGFARIEGKIPISEFVCMLVRQQTPDEVALALAAHNPLRLGLDDFELYAEWRQSIPDNVILRDQDGGEFSLLDDSECHRAFFNLCKTRPDLTPGFHVYRSVRDVLRRNTKAAPKKSEQTDLMHISALPYVDVLFTDAQIYAALNATSISDDLKRKCISNGRFGTDFLKDPTCFLEYGHSA